MDDLCGRSITLGSRQDPYGASCDLPIGHSGPHIAPDPFGRDGHYEWSGGGMVAGDPLPVRSPRFVEYDETLVRQYGERFARAHTLHYRAVMVIQEFSDRHPLHIDDPRYPRTETGPRFTIRNPERHTLSRIGDMLSCIECGESVYAPPPPKRPLTPMEASLSPFD